MLGSSSTAAATLSTNTSSATPTSPSRPSRLRGLSYLRNYTHHTFNLHSNNDPPTPTRADAPRLTRSSTAPASPSRKPVPPPQPQPATEQQEKRAPSPQRSETAGNTTSGWVPTVGGQSGISRVATQPQSTSTDPSGAEQASVAPMTRSRAATATSANVAAGADSTQPTPRRLSLSGSSTPNAEQGQPEKNQPSIRFIPHHEPRATRPSLSFPIISRVLPNEATIIKIGRYSERDNNAADALSNPKSTAPVGFKSKVVSRRHCELWCSSNQWYIKDVKSSSGTFLNHVRLSSPGVESRPYPVNDGDVIQLGIDFKGGEEVIFRCVKIRVECNRGWQKSLNKFNTSTHTQIIKPAKAALSKDSDAQSVNTSECSICLNSVSPCQALFVAPCSHVWHYKCVRTLIYPSWPTFQCPNCRAYADLEADVDQPEMEDSGEELGDALEKPEEVEDLEGSGSPTNGSRRPASRKGLTNSGMTEEELSGMMNSTSLTASSSESAPSEETSAASQSQPVPIHGSSRASTNDTSDPIRSMTPTSTTQFALAAGVMQGDGPMTPRNDVGPFLLDGSALRRRDLHSIAQIAAEGEDSAT